MRKPAKRDSISAYQRETAAARRVGIGSRCTVCGEDRPEALIPNSNPMICAACQRKKQEKSVIDDHHFAGRANSDVTIPAVVNDHRADLNTAQHDWPLLTLQNPDGSPLLAAAGCIRGFIDTVLHLIEKGLEWVAGMLEKLDAYLTEKWGPRWWLNTPVEQFAHKKEGGLKP